MHLDFKQVLFANIQISDIHCGMDFRHSKTVRYPNSLDFGHCLKSELTKVWILVEFGFQTVTAALVKLMEQLAKHIFIFDYSECLKSRQVQILDN